MRHLKERDARDHPKLGPLLGLLLTLEQMPPILAAVHRGGEPSAVSDQARSMSQVCELLGLQVRAYVKLLTWEEDSRER